VEARSPGRRSNVKNASHRRPVTDEPDMTTSHILRDILRTPPVTRQPQASSACRPRPAGRLHYVIISRDGRKLLTRVRIVAIATQPVPQLQIRPIVHNEGAASTTPASYIWVRAVVWAYGRGHTHTHRQTDTQKRVTTIHFASSTTHAKCKYITLIK